MIGRTYLERGRPVTVLARWAAAAPSPVPGWLTWSRAPRPGGPRNVLIVRADGHRVVRPFRGLRRPHGGEDR